MNKIVFILSILLLVLLVGCSGNKDNSSKYENSSIISLEDNDETNIKNELTDKEFETILENNEDKDDDLSSVSSKNENSSQKETSSKANSSKQNSSSKPQSTTNKYDKNKDGWTDGWN